MATELAVGERFTLTPKNLTEAMEFAKLIANSDICPKDFQGKPGNVLIAVQMGAEVGLSALQALQNIAPVNGRPTIWGDACLALVRASGKLEFHEERDQSDCVAAGGGLCRVKRRGEPNVVERKFSIEDAKTAKLWGKTGKDGQSTPWITNPGRMLQMRARAFALRDVFPDVLKGLSVREEVEDFVDTTGATVTGPDPMQPRAIATAPAASPTVAAPAPAAAQPAPTPAAPAAPKPAAAASVDDFVKENPSKAAQASSREREPAPGSKRYGVVSAEKVEKEGKKTFYRVVFWNYDRNAEFKASTFSDSLFELASTSIAGDVVAEFVQKGEYTNIVAMKAVPAAAPAGGPPDDGGAPPPDDVPFN